MQIIEPLPNGEGKTKLSGPFLGCIDAKEKKLMLIKYLPASSEYCLTSFARFVMFDGEFPIGKLMVRRRWTEVVRASGSGPGQDCVRARAGIARAACTKVFLILRSSSLDNP